MYNIFISYSHSNKPFAKKLFRGLKKYRPLFKLNGRKKLSVFLDEAEANVNDLSQGIIDAIKDSEKMIVLCSPESKNSKWVDKELKLFKELHGHQNIIPVLIEGEPSSSFSELFKKVFPAEPWAVDFRENKFKKLSQNKNSWYHLLASIYGVSRKVVEQREFYKRLSIGFTTTIIIASISIAAYFFYNQKLEKESLDLVRQASEPYDNNIVNFDQRLRLSIKALQKANTKQAREVITKLLGVMLDVMHPDEGISDVVANEKSDWIFFHGDFGSGILYNWKTNEKNILYRSYMGTDKAIFSNDGKYLLVADNSGNAKIWNVSKKSLQSSFQFDSGNLKSREIAFTPDDLSVITIAEKTHFWDVETGRLIKKIEEIEEMNFFVDTINKEIVYKKYQAYSSHLPDLAAPIYFYNYRNGNNKELDLNSLESDVLLDVNFKTGELFIQEGSKQIDVPDTAFNIGVVPDSALLDLLEAQKEAQKGVLKILHFNKKKEIESVEEIEPKFANFNSLLKRFPETDIVKKIICDSLNIKYNSILPCNFDNENAVVLPYYNYLIVTADCNKWESDTAQHAYIFDLKDYRLIDSLEWKYGDIQQFFFSKNYSNVVFYSKASLIHGNDYLTFWDFDKRQLLKTETLGITHLQLTNNQLHIVATKGKSTREDTSLCFVKVFDFNGKTIGTTNANNFFYSWAYLLDESGLTFITNNYDTFYIWHLNQKPTINAIPFMEDDLKLLERDKKMINENLPKDKLLEIAHHWVDFN